MRLLTLDYRSVLLTLALAPAIATLLCILSASINVPDKPARSVKLAVYLKNDWRYSEFLAPSDVKGTPSARSVGAGLAMLLGRAHAALGEAAWFESIR